MGVKFKEWWGKVSFKEWWKKLPNWLKGGLLGLCLLLILEILFILLFEPPVETQAIFGSLFSPLAFVFLFIRLGAIFFLFGAFVGFLVGKLKRT